MNYWITFILGSSVAFLIWVIATQKVKLPILFEAGLAAIAIGLVVCADSVVMSDSYSPRGAGLIAAGMALSFLSMRRQLRKRRKALREGEPFVIDGGSFRRN